MSDWKPVAYMPLHVQQPEAIQRGLFVHAIEPQPVEPCGHPTTQEQLRLASNLVDIVCNACGTVVHTYKAFATPELQRLVYGKR